MDFFSRLSRTEAGQEPTDLARVRADDALIEALRTAPLFDGVDTDHVDYSSTASAAAPGDAGDTVTSAMLSSSDDQVAQLLQAWRREIDSVPMPAPIDIAVATAVVKLAPSRRRAMRPMLAVTAAIAALLVGSAAIGARSATPNDALWPVTQLLWGDRADSVKAGIDARLGIDEASNALEAGNPDAAETAIDWVTVRITEVEPRDGLDELTEDLAQVQQDLNIATGGRPTTTASVPSTVTLPTAPTSTSAAPTTSEQPPAQTTPADNPTTPDPGTSQPPTSDPVVPPTDPVDPTGPTDTPTSSTDETSSSTESTDSSTETSSTEVTTSGDAQQTVNDTTLDGPASVVDPTA